MLHAAQEVIAKSHLNALLLYVAGAAITLATKSIAITVSESTGTVRIWRKGQLITEIEKAKRTAAEATALGD